MTLPSLNGTRVLVTGGTGFVGRHLLPALAAAGADISCLTRPRSDTRRLPTGARPVRADLLHGTGLDDALEGQDIVIHMAALLFGLGWQDYLRANARAAALLGEALTRHAPRRVILVSSLAATGPSARSPGVNDATPPAPVSAYGWSKLLAEQILGRHVGDRLVVLRPPIIYGSGDRGLLPCFQGARRGLAVSPGLGRPFPVSAVHARDMVQALLLACLPQAHGVYHLNDGAEHTMRSLGQAMGAALGRRVRTLAVPLPVMAAASALSSLGGHILARLPGTPRRAPSLNCDKYREARQEGWLCDAARIAAELGYRPRIALAAGMAEAVAGYRRDGWL